MEQFYYWKATDQDGQAGPATTGAIQGMMREGRLSPDARVCLVGTVDWFPARVLEHAQPGTHSVTPDGQGGSHDDPSAGPGVQADSVAVSPPSPVQQSGGQNLSGPRASGGLRETLKRVFDTTPLGGGSHAIPPALTKVAKVAGALGLLYLLVLGGDRLYSGGKRMVDREAYGMTIYASEADYISNSDYGFSSAFNRQYGLEQPDLSAYKVSGVIVSPGTIVELLDRDAVSPRSQKLVWVRVVGESNRQGSEGIAPCSQLLTLGLGRDSC